MGKPQKSETDLPPPTQAELSILDLIDEAFLPAYLDEAGFDVTEQTRYSSFADTPEGKKLYAKREKLQEEQNQKRKIGGPAPALDFGPTRQIDEEIKKKEEKFVPYTDRTTRKRDAPDVEAIRDKYGPESKQYKEAKASYQKEVVATERQTRNIKKTFLTKVDDYLNGKISVTPEQEKFISDNLAPTRAAVEAMYSENPDEVIQKYGKFAKDVSTSGMNITQALNAVGAQVKQTGVDMEKALTSTMETHKQLLKMGIEDATGEITKNVSMQAIATGRDPSDPEYQKEIQDSVSREVSRGTLNLAGMEAQGRMGIAERTGGGLEDVARSRVSAAEQKGQAMARLAEAGSNLRQQFAAGQPLSQINVGSGFSQLDQTLSQQRLMNASHPMGMASGQLGYFQGERMAQPTVTTQQGFSPMDAVSAGAGIASGGASIYAGAIGATAMREMASRYEGYG